MQVDLLNVAQLQTLTLDVPLILELNRGEPKKRLYGEGYLKMTQATATHSGLM